jgi:hypothetical protein
MNELDRLATVAKMGSPGMAPQGMAPQGMPMAPQGMAPQAPGMKKGGSVKAKAKSKSSSASKRADGIAQRGKTKGRMV